MRLSIMLLGSLLACSIVSAAENLQENVSMANTALLGVNGMDTNQEKLLRSSETDEERLGGNNMFNVEKIEKALQDASYAKTLFRRWKRHGVEYRAAYDKLTKFGIGYDKKIFALYKNYVAWLTKHHPLGVWETGASPNLFSKTKLNKAMADSKYANVMFGRWKRHGFESDAVYTKLLALNLASDQNVYKIYTDYVSWLDLHHRLARTRKVTSRNFLFNADEVVRAKTDTSLARSIFSKWKTNGLDSRPVYLKLLEMGLKPNGDDGLFRLYVNYVNWLNVHYR